MVDDDPNVVLTITVALEGQGYAVEEAASAESAMARLDQEQFPVVISDIYMAEKTGLDLLRHAKALNPNGAVILMTGKGTLETDVEAHRAGVFDYVSKPFSIEKLVLLVSKAMMTTQEKARPLESSKEPASAMVGHSARMVEVYNFVSRVAATDATVLLRGETGTGKELVAQLIHQNSARARGRFVVVDCAAIPATLLESELFGALRGSYTGADRDRVGLFEAANNGTVFLDEIGEIDPSFQLRLLRFLQEKEVRPVGSNTSRKVDVRVIAATNKNLEQMRSDGRFRDDLWYRLSVASLDLPPLRERREDIPLLVARFLEEYESRYDRRIRLDDGGLRLLVGYAWPGNVRQLRHLLERLVILSSATVIDAEQVASVLPVDSGGGTRPSGPAVVESLDDVEEEQIRKILVATGGNKTKAAEILGIERKTLYRKLARMEGREG